MNEAVTESCGNVFADLGFSHEESTVLAMRAALMASLHEKAERAAWTTAQAASILGISEAQVSDLMQGKRDSFSLDVLVGLATRGGCKINLSIA